MPVALHVATDARTIKHIQCGEQGGGAIALVITRHRTATPPFERQPRPGAVKRLYL